MDKDTKRGPGRPEIPADQRSVVAAVSFRPDVLAALDRQAELENCSRSKLIDKLLRPWLKRAAKRR